MISDEKVIDGSSLYNMLRIAFTSLSYNESYLNDINTFPVSDSDTGTNMKRTLRMGLLTTSQEQTAGELIRSLADNMSLSSRGNSGFILSQYFMGLSEYLKDKNVITIEIIPKIKPAFPNLSPFFTAIKPNIIARTADIIEIIIKHKDIIDTIPNISAAIP